MEINSERDADEFMMGFALFIIVDLSLPCSPLPTKSPMANNFPPALRIKSGEDEHLQLRQEQ